MPFVSIQLNSNRPEQIVLFFNSIEATADTPSDIEILLHMDQGDTVMMQAMQHEQATRPFTLKLLQTDLVKGYATLWKPLNPLFKLTDPDAYFVINLSDEMLFKTKGWDSIIRAYIGYYPDHIFRLRGSKYRFRNYTDFWECGYAPDSLAFYTRRWLELGEDWNPCLGPDSFQQCVAFYLYTSDPFSHTQYNRDIPLTELEFTGEGAGIGLEGRAKYQRMRVNNRAWFILMSYRMQKEAKRRAMRLKSHIIAHAKNADEKSGAAFRVTESRFASYFSIARDGDKKQVQKISYKLSRMQIALTNIGRMPWVFYYAGGGRHALRHVLFGRFVMFATYAPFGTFMLTQMDRLQSRVMHFRRELRHPVNHFRHVLRARLRPYKRNLIRGWRLIKDIAYANPILAAHNGERKLLSGTLALGIVSWAGASALYSLQVRFLRLLPLRLRQTLKPSLRKWRFGTFKRDVKRKIQAIPNLRFIVRGKIVFLLLSLLKNIPWLIFSAGVRVADAALSALKGLFSLTHFRKRMKRSSHTSWLDVAMPDNAAPAQAAPVLQDTVLFSIQLSSNRPHQVADLLDNIERTADNPTRIELLVHIDTGDSAMLALLDGEKQKRRVKIRYLETDLVKGFSDLWKSYNPLFKLTDPNAYFVTLFSDEMRFETHGWDSMLAGYIGYYPDHIFRIRGSKYRYRNYTDYWECGFAPDSLAFYTRRWLSIQGDWNPCTGPDSFQQCVSYYLFSSDPFSHVQYNRDIIAPFIRFSGEGASVGLEGEARLKRIRDNNREWFTLMSQPMQMNAKRRAMLLKATIILLSERLAHPEESFKVAENAAARQFAVKGADGRVIEEMSYAVSRLKTRLKTLLRAPWVHYYAGGGEEALRTNRSGGFTMMIDTFSPRGRRLMVKKERFDQKVSGGLRALSHKRNHVRGTWKQYGILKGTAVLAQQVREHFLSASATRSRKGKD